MQDSNYTDYRGMGLQNEPAPATGEPDQGEEMTGTNGTTESEAPFEANQDLTKMPLLTREMIFAAQDIQQEIVEVPEWGGRVLVRGLTANERDRFETSIVMGKGRDREVNLRSLRAKLVALSVVDETGRRLFEDHDVARLGEKSAAALARLYDVASRLSGLSEADAQELAKNSDDDPSGGLRSA